MERASTQDTDAKEPTQRSELCSSFDYHALGSDSFKVPDRHVEDEVLIVDELSCMLTFKSTRCTGSILCGAHLYPQFLNREWDCENETRSQAEGIVVSDAHKQAKPLKAL